MSAQHPELSGAVPHSSTDLHGVEICPQRHKISHSTIAAQLLREVRQNSGPDLIIRVTDGGDET